MLGLLGPNGAGKTSLLRVMATAVPPTSGRMRLLGADSRRLAQVMFLAGLSMAVLGALALASGAGRRWRLWAAAAITTAGLLAAGTAIALAWHWPARCPRHDRHPRPA